MKKGIKNLKISKRTIAIIVASSIAAGGLGYALTTLFSKHRVVHDKNSIGYEDINYIHDFNVNPEDFVILNVGDHDSIGTWSQDKKITKCNDEDITVGIVINSDAKNELDIYNDVEYVKGLVKKYKIDFPVYLDIDNIITNDSLNIEMKRKIVLDFLEKCSSNGIYVGIKGTDTNLSRLKKYCKIEGYEAFIVMDKDEIEYDGTYNIVKDLDGNIKSKTNIKEIIDSKKLNNEESFLGDFAYKVKENEKILDISLKYGISVKELLSFNDLKESDITPGTLIRIPSVIDNETSNISGEKKEYKTANEPLRGCDISYAQGTDSNWEELSKNFDFIILRSNFGVDEDATFQENAINCNKFNIPMGVYCYNNYCRLDCGDNIELFKKKQLDQVNKTLELLKNKKVDYPVYLDIEQDEGLSFEIFTKEQVKEMLNIWIEKISEAGYIPGIYCNSSGYEFLQSCVDYDISEKLEVWLAGGNQYFADKRDIDLKDVVPSDILSNPAVKMAQSTDSCVNSGAGNSEGHLDIDFSDIDYANPSKVPIINENKKESAFAIKDFTRINIGAYATQAGTIAISGVVGYGLIRHHKKKKNKVK